MALLVESLASMLEGLSLIPAPHKPGMFMCFNPGMQEVEAGDGGDWKVIVIHTSLRPA